LAGLTVQLADVATLRRPRRKRCGWVMPSFVYVEEPSQNPRPAEGVMTIPADRDRGWPSSTDPPAGRACRHGIDQGEAPGPNARGKGGKRQSLRLAQCHRCTPPPRQGAVVKLASVVMYWLRLEAWSSIMKGQPVPAGFVTESTLMPLEARAATYQAYLVFPASGRPSAE